MKESNDCDAHDNPRRLQGNNVVHESILPRIAAGDRTAVSECLDRYGGLVWSLARRMLSSSEDAEDAVQDIFVELWQKAERFTAERGSEATFIVTIARRRLIDRQRQWMRRRGREAVNDAKPDVDALPGPEQKSFAEISEEAAVAKECLKGLRQDERQVLELSIYHGCSQSAIAQHTGLPLGTVKTHARRGMQKLRTCVGESTHAVAKRTAT